MDISLNMGNVQWDHKPTNQETQYTVQPNELNETVTMDITDIAWRLVHGYNARFSACNGNKDENFISAQLLAVDIDNETDHPYSPEDVKQILESKNIKPCFMNETWNSWKKGNIRFRVAILLSKKIEKRSQHRALTAYIYSLFNDNIDTSVKNESRIFFGSGIGHLLYEDFSAVNDTDELLKQVDVSKYLQFDTLGKGQKVKKGKGRKKRTGSYSGSAIPDADVINAIREHDSQYLRDRFNRKPMQFENNYEFFEYLNCEVSLAELFDVQEQKSFVCIFHKDGNESNPSATVMRTDNGIWIYTCRANKCIANKRSLTIKDLVEEIGCFHSTYKSIKFLKEAFNLSIKETEWQIEQRENIAYIRNAFNNTSAFAFDEMCPVASANCRYSKGVYNTILSIAEQNIDPVKNIDGIENIIFPMSVRFLTKAAGCSSVSKTSNYLKQLQYHHLIRAIPDEELPAHFKKKAEALQKKEGTRKHISYFELPSFVLSVTIDIEEQGIKWRDYKYRLKHLSYEEFYRAEGAEVAAEMFPLHKTIKTKDGTEITRTKTKKSDEITMQIAGIILELIEQQGYATEKQVIEATSIKHGIDKYTVEKQIQRSIAEILASYSLIKRRLNKQLKERFRIEAKGYPFIILSEQEI